MSDTQKRTLLFLSLDDEHTIDVVDDGMIALARDRWTPRQGRARILVMLREFVEVDGRRLQRFMLKEPPSHIFEANDPLDVEKFRHKDGKWHLPDDAWMAERARRVNAKAAKKGVIRERLADKDANDAARLLAPLLRKVDAAENGAKPKKEAPRG